MKNRPRRKRPRTSTDDSDSKSNAPCQATKDEDYYMCFVTFEVEDCLFRVPSYQFFKESTEFCEIHELLEHVTMADDGNPIKLEMVTQKDFRSLLKVLYPLSLPVELSLSKEEWISVLTLTSRWRFLRVREIAKIVLDSERLGSLTSVEKICLGRDLSIPSWVIDGFIGLVEATTITDEEALKIDSGAVATAYKLFRIREQRIAGELCFALAKTKVEEIFKKELDRLRSTEKMLRNTTTNN